MSALLRKQALQPCKHLIASLAAAAAPPRHLKHLCNVAMRCYCPQTFLSLDSSARMMFLNTNRHFGIEKSKLCHAGLFLPSQLSSIQSETEDMQRFAAPEQDCSSLDGLVQSASAASDIFMLGVLTYEVLVGKHAFPMKDDGIGRARRWQVLVCTTLSAHQDATR